MLAIFRLVETSLPGATLTTTNVQGSGANWTAAIWKTNTSSTNFFAPTAGNTYQGIANGTAFGNNANNTRIRNPATAGVQTFPGDCLILNTNTELRMKAASAILNFPGAGSSPGLVLNGGVLNTGDNTVFVITGRVQVTAQSYICMGDNGGGAAMPLRGVDMSGDLSGNGTLVFMQASNTTAQRISGTSNSFSGQWIVKAGWLMASGTNSLGTNSITINPGYVLPLSSSVINVAGPALFEPGYDLNSAGTLTLTNGGTMRLHQNCIFGAARIEGVSLSAGSHSYAELVSSFPYNFTSDGSGSITVQPYGPPPRYPPTFVQQPVSLTLPSGSSAQFAATVIGAAPLSYQWQKGTNGIYVTLNDGSGLSGSRTNVLRFNAAAPSDSADYRLTVTNSVGSATSQVATLTVLARPTVLTMDPPANSQLGALTRITVTFSSVVTGVEPEDLQVNGLPASDLSGSGSVYTFGFTQPFPGNVAISWDPDSVITDVAGNALDTSGSWYYTLVDALPPTVAAMAPAPGSTVSSIAQVEVYFSEPVEGVQSSDLLANGASATGVTGSGLGPYRFQFNEPARGNVTFLWAANHNIRDQASNRLSGSSWTVRLDPDAALAALTNIVINEFVAANVLTNGLRDEDGVLSDWIELHNRGSTDVNLTGWSIAEAPDLTDKWTLPATNLNAGAYLILFASGKDRRMPGNNLHLSFALETSGEYLGLYNPDVPPRLAHQYSPKYPEQRNDFSYGLDTHGQGAYFSEQTPGGPNSLSTLTGIVDAVQFSVSRGWFNQPFNLVLAVSTPGANIRYTSDGTPPTEITGMSYSAPLPIDRTTVLRAAAFAPGQLSSPVKTHTYIFPASTLAQPAAPPGFPITTSWCEYGWPSDYGMSPAIATNPLYSGTIQSDLMSLPALSIVMDTDAMFGETSGLYTHPTALSLEAPCSVELVSANGQADFQCEAGIKMHGGGSRARTMKHPFRLVFRGQYGAGELKEAFFPDSPVRSFDVIDLRADYNNHWTHGFDAVQRARGGLVRDTFLKDLNASMGALSSHSRYVQLFINGLYWGVYNPCERPDENFAASYLGGSKTNYDAFNGTGAQLLNGNTIARNAMLSLNTTNLADPAQYAQMKAYLDVPQYIDYMIAQLYAANWDWGAQKNWYAIRQREPGAGFKYLSWDSERTLEGLNDKVSVSPDNLQANLVRNSEYRLEFADHVHKHFFNGGALTPARVAALWQARAAQVDRAMILESARWGDSVPSGKTALSPLPYPSYTTGTTYTREENWLGEQGRLLTNYFPFRSGVVLTQFMQANLYPALSAPVFNQHGGPVPLGFLLSMSAPTGTIYYTLDGSDPRLSGLGIPSPAALTYTNPFALRSDTLAKARAWSAGTWSALNEAAFQVSGPGLAVRFTEIMYNPIGGDAYEFIELQNVGATPADLSRCSFEGIDYVFPSPTVLSPGGVLVLASSANPAAFALRYPGVLVAGYYGGALNNSGERVALIDANGRTVISVDYGTSGGWPTAANGLGSSLELTDPFGDPDDPANWRASLLPNGSPGLPNSSAAPPVVRFSEVMADNAGAVTNGGTFPDWIELFNSSQNSVSLANWSLSNSGNPRRYVFPGNATIAPRGFLIVWCDNQTNAPGLHAAFALGRKGESLFLFDPSTNRVDAFSFGLQVSNLSMGYFDASGWQLAVPTPGTNNVPATTAAATNLVLNEWLANPLPGADDWLEIYNPSTLPVPLSGLYLSTSNQLYQIRSKSFIGPSGFVQLFADEKPGPDHLDFKLSAAGDCINLLDSSGQLINSVAFVSQVEGVSQGRFPNGGPDIVAFPGTASPGASNYRADYAGPLLNEVMARNSSAVYDSQGNCPDWIELVNPTASTCTLSGMGLGTSPSGAQWIVPAAVSLGPSATLAIWCDGSRAASTNNQPQLNTGFSLNGGGETLYLFNAAGQIVDSVSFGPQVTDVSIGRSGGRWQLLSSPSPGIANAGPALLGNVADVRINEWMANPLSGEDWFELYNSGQFPTDLGGLFLTDNPSIPGMTNSPIPPLTFLGPGSWLKFEADGNPAAGPGHAAFKLNPVCGALRLYDFNSVLIDAVDYGLQQPGVSEGRLPDGAAAIARFPGSATPEHSNYLPFSNLFINEVLTHTDPPLEDAVELYNSGTVDQPIGSWFLSNSETDFKKFRVPSNTVVPGGGFRVWYEYQFNGTNDVPFTLNSAHGDSVFLSQADGAGQLTGYRAQLTFGAAENGVSWGRVSTSVGADFVPLARRSFGLDNPTSLTQFRTGPGLTNSGPKIGPVVVTEIMSHPVTWSGTNATENPDEEYIELLNITFSPAPLYDPDTPANRWKIGGAIDFAFPAGAVLSANSYALVVHFDPAVDTAALANFRAKYSVPPSIPIFGPYSGRLNNSGETLALYKPDAPQTAPHPDAGYVPYILVEQITWTGELPWPEGANGAGMSLQRRVATNYGNEPLNWLACAPSPGAANCGVDADDDGLPDEWEVANGLSPTSAVGDDGAEGDPDRDGFTNREEYLAGTHPRDPLSGLRLAAFASGPNAVTLRFNAVAGHSYTIQYRSSITTEWQKLIDMAPPTLGSIMDITDTNALEATRFYRLVTPRTP